MHRNRRSYLALALAVGAVFLAATPADAGWWHHGYRQKIVIRGGVPWFGPAFGFGTGVSSGEFFLSPFGASSGEFFLSSGMGGSAREFAREFAREYSLQESARRRESDTDAGRVRGPGTPPGTAPAVSDSCAQLATRLDKLETRIGDVSKRLETIEAKVDRLLREKDEEQQAKFIVGLVKQSTESALKEQNQKMFDLLEELSKEKRDQARVQELLNKLKGK
jgi:hypothetical protein